MDSQDKEELAYNHQWDDDALSKLAYTNVVGGASNSYRVQPSVDTSTALISLSKIPREGIRRHVAIPLRCLTHEGSREEERGEQDALSTESLRRRLRGKQRKSSPRSYQADNRWTAAVTTAAPAANCGVDSKGHWANSQAGVRQEACPTSMDPEPPRKGTSQRPPPA